MYQGMPQHDKQTVTKLIRELLKRNCTLIVSDEEYSQQPTSDFAVAMDQLGNSDLNRVVAFDKNHQRLGCFLLIYGNGYRETISDCSANMFCESVCAAIGEPI